MFGGPLLFSVAVTALLGGRGWVCALVVGEARRVRFNEAPLPLNVCAVPKETSAEAGEAPAVTADGAPRVWVSLVLPRSCPRSCPVLHCLHPRSVAGLALGPGAL